jgi:nucleotide-binding universal stress UspA family protein
MEQSGLSRLKGEPVGELSSQGKGWLKQIRVGSVSFDVARRADRPVLVVRQKKQ